MKQNSNKKRSNGRHGRLNNNHRLNNGITRNTVFDSSSPAGRIRGMAAQLIEKYISLAKDAKANDDRVLCETYMQYAEHYIRMQEIALANDAPKQHDDTSKEENLENAPEDNTAITEETSPVQKNEGENNECGVMPLEADVPEAEADAKPNACDVVDDVVQQNKSKKPQFRNKKRRIKIENNSEDNTVQSTEAEEK